MRVSISRLIIWRSTQAGRRGRFAKPLVGATLAGVRIPASPPQFVRKPAILAGFQRFYTIIFSALHNSGLRPVQYTLKKDSNSVDSLHNLIINQSELQQSITKETATAAVDENLIIC